MLETRVGRLEVIVSVCYSIEDYLVDGIIKSEVWYSICNLFNFLLMILVTNEFFHVGHFSRPNTDYITLIKQLVFLLLLPLLLIILQLEVIKEAD